MKFKSQFRPYLDAATAFETIDITPQANGPTIEPMTLRFNGYSKGVVSSVQLVGPKSGKVTTSVYKGEDMWRGITPILPYLPELTAYCGDVLHFACAVIHEETSRGKETRRYPICLVQAMDIPDPEAAANFSKANLRKSSVKVGPGEYVQDSLRYVAFAKEANKQWLEANNVSFFTPRTKAELISTIEDALVELRSL